MVAEAVRSALAGSRYVRDVRLIGSRADGRAHELSDWDFAVETDEFEALARELPILVAPLHPIAEQWDRYSPHACYMLILAGPTKIDLLFLGQPQDYAPPWAVTAETLEAVDRHFWDWILWLEQKRRAGRVDVLVPGLESLHRYLLAPLGAEEPPGSVAGAVATYLRARGAAEERFGLAVPRRLEREVRPVLEGG